MDADAALFRCRWIHWSLVTHDAYRVYWSAQTLLYAHG